jgi:hypothetical protein
MFWTISLRLSIEIANTVPMVLAFEDQDKLNRWQ